MDFGDYKIKLNVATGRLFEQLTGKSFLSFTDEDTMQIIYCALCANNDFNYSYETFLSMLGNRKIANWLLKEFERLSKFQMQLKYTHRDDILSNGDDKADVQVDNMISDFAAILIVNHGMDPHYVNYEMELWEMWDYFNAAEKKKRADLEESRLWTYLTMLPHLNPKKKIKPEQILPFPWENETEKNKKFMEVNMDAIMKTFKTNTDGETRTDTDNIGEGLGEAEPQTE